MSLNEITLYRPCRIIEINKNSPMLRRFLDIGIIPETKIEKVLTSPFGGIQAYSIMGATIAIRDNDAKEVIVSYEEI